MEHVPSQKKESLPWVDLLNHLMPHDPTDLKLSRLDLSDLTLASLKLKIVWGLYAN